MSHPIDSFRSPFAVLLVAFFSSAGVGAASPPVAAVLGDVRLQTAYADLATADPSLGAGFAVAALFAQGKTAAACARLAQVPADATPLLRAAWAVRSAPCASQPGFDEAALLVGATFPPLSDDPVLQWEVVRALLDQSSPLLAQRVATHYLKRVADVTETLPSRSQQAREAAASVVAVAADDKAWTARAHRFLYAHLGETGAARAALSKMEPALQKHRELALALTRARVLQSRHDNPGVVATLAPHGPAKTDMSTTACETRLLLGKAARKTRQYKTANRHLKVVSTSCGEPWKKKARYLLGRVATFSGQKDAPQILDTFIAAYPDDGLTDDVLLWKAEWFGQRGDPRAAEAAYRQIIDRFPEGDMVPVARFDIGFLLAREGKRKAALAAWDTASRVAAGHDPFDADQALYWSARLRLMPDVNTMSLNKDDAEREAGWTAMVALAQSRSISFYGDLARQVSFSAAQTLGREAAWRKATADASRVPRHQARHGIALSPSALDDDATVKAAADLMANGYGDIAEILLDGIDRAGLGEKGRFTLAGLYAVLGRSDRAHQAVRFAKKGGGAILPGRPTAASIRVWELAYPRAHADALTAGAKAAALPPEMLIGLSREESAFEAEVVSWAGASGLCQLMPRTANEEAGILKLEKPTRARLFDPVYNARLGGNHLGRRLKLLEHPLLAIAAYNAGPGNVRKWRRKGPRPIDAFVESIPVAQTRGYVKKVTGSWLTYTWLDRQASIRYDLMLPAP